MHHDILNFSPHPFLRKLQVRNIPIFLVGCVLVALSFVIFRLYQRIKRPSSSLDEKQQQVHNDPYLDIEPLLDFDWKSTPPIKLRPFKPNYHLTMALEQIPLSNLVEIDSTYLSRLALRRELLDVHPDATHLATPEATPAIDELYTWLLRVYLPRRFPTMYALHPLNAANPMSLHDRVLDEHIPLRPLPSPREALRTLGRHIDTDFLILLPSLPSASPDQPSPQSTYHLKAFTTTFPSGFSTASKLNLSLAAIHTPVPRYKPKLSKSMDRFFARLPAGQCVRRANWAVTTDDTLFAEGGTHFHTHDDDADDASKEEREAAWQARIAAERETVDVSACRLRVERQTLHRLPETGALVFAFKTYQYGLEEVKQEGLGWELADAVEGLGKGSVPEMEVYKRGVVWGEKVCEFLRG